MSWNNIIPASMLGDIVEKKKYKPIDPTIAMLKIQQALADNPKAKYIELLGFRKYCDDSTHVQFERGIPQLYEYQKEFKKWVITKWYIPADAKIKVHKWKKDQYYTPVPGQNKPASSIVVIEIPPESYSEVIVRDCKNGKDAVKIKNHILNHFNNMYRIVREGRGRKTRTCAGVTYKNWKILDTEPDFTNMIKMVKDRPQMQYVHTSGFRNKGQKMVEDRLKAEMHELQDGLKMTEEEWSSLLKR